MFTGIVAGVGRIVEVERLSLEGGVRLTIDASDVPAFAVRVGDSVAIAGACMTAIRVDGTTFAVDTSKESLARTSGLDAPGEVNIETSLRVGDSLGGHLVAGHVDGVGEVVSMTQAHESWHLVVRAPARIVEIFCLQRLGRDRRCEPDRQSGGGWSARLRVFGQRHSAHVSSHDVALVTCRPIASISKSTRSRAMSSGCCRFGAETHKLRSPISTSANRHAVSRPQPFQTASSPCDYQRVDRRDSARPHCRAG